MPKENSLAAELTGVALRQLTTSWTFKQPRILQIRKFRDLYNNKVPKQLRIRYNVPIPIFAGMIDTLQADLDDELLLKYGEQDPADWKAAVKANAYIQKESQSMRPGAKWNSKFRLARQELLMCGRTALKYVPSSENGYSADLSVVPFEDFYFEPKGGGQLENHLFCGQGNIWKTKKALENEAGGMYDAAQVKRLTAGDASGNAYKMSDFWTQYDFANRFLSLNLTAESNNYVGEPVYNLVEWVLTYKGDRWYLLFEAFSGTWIRFEKLTDVHSSGYFPWMSMASHEDVKNFASKGFADDLYPSAMAMTDFFNEDLENRKRRNSNSRAYDKDMVPNVAQLDQAQMGRDRLVEIDTKGGTRRLSEAIYTFQTPEITGTIDMLGYMEQLAGRNFGVTDMQKGQAQAASKAVGVTYAEMGQVSKRLSFQSQPFIELGQELGMRVFGGLKDYLKEPLSIKLLGENGYEWDTLKRIDLNLKKEFEISVSSQAKENKMNEMLKQDRMNALNLVKNQTAPPNPNVNSKKADEFILRDLGKYSEQEIAEIMDPQNTADKEAIAETSAVIQDIMMGRQPKMNYNATGYFLQKILDFVKTHQDDPKVGKKMDSFMAYLQAHSGIAMENEQRRAMIDAQAMMQAPGNPNNPMGNAGQMQNPNVQTQGGQPGSLTQQQQVGPPPVITNK